MAWSLSDDDPDLKKDVTMRMGVHFKRFRHDPNKDYVMKNKTPFTKFTNITQADWDAFVAYHQSEEFENLSKLGKASRSNNGYQHFLGSRGYDGEKFQNRLKEALKKFATEEGSSSDLLSCGSTTDLSEEQLLNMSVQHRHIAWKLAREKVLDGGALIYPNPETKAIIKTIEEKSEAYKQGMLTIERYNDVLGSSLPNPEHSGRVRGVGIKKTYKGCGKRKRLTFDEYEAVIEQRIQREVEERMKDMKEENEAFKRQMAMQHEALQRKMALLMANQIDTRNPLLISSPGAGQSSFSSVEKPHFIDSIEEECKCKLHLVRDGQKIQVAVGTVSPSLQGTVIHFKPIPPGHAKVMVDDYVAGENDTPVPVPNGEVETLRSARFSFTAWPKDLISLDEEPLKELQVPPSGISVHSDAFAPKQYQGFDGLNFDNLGPHFKNLRDLFLKKFDNAFDVDLPLDLFHSEDAISSILVHADNFRDLITPKKWLTAPIIQIFMMYMHKYYKDGFSNELVGFMDPGKTNCTYLSGNDQDRDFVDKYISKSLKEN